MRGIRRSRRLIHEWSSLGRTLNVALGTCCAPSLANGYTSSNSPTKINHGIVIIGKKMLKSGRSWDTSRRALKSHSRMHFFCRSVVGPKVFSHASMNSSVPCSIPCCTICRRPSSLCEYGCAPPRIMEWNRSVAYRATPKPTQPPIE